MNSRFRSSTKEERDAQRAQIIQFCATPKTYQEVAIELVISGISAAAFLSQLKQKDVCIHNPRKDTFRTRKRFLKHAD